MSDVIKEEIQKHYSWVYSVCVNQISSLTAAREDWIQLEDPKMVEFFAQHIQHMEQMRDYLREKLSQ